MTAFAVTDVPGLVVLPATPAADVHLAARAQALLQAHGRRPLHDADGPIDEDHVVRSAVRMLRDHKPWAARG